MPVFEKWKLWREWENDNSTKQSVLDSVKNKFRDSFISSMIDKKYEEVKEQKKTKSRLMHILTAEGDYWSNLF